MEMYVCAFRGRRDSYQVPLALAEGGLLDQFITDFYAVPWIRMAASLGPEALRTKIDLRSEPGIPVTRVRCLWGSTIFEHFRHRIGCSPLLTFNKFDCYFSQAAARRAARAQSHLFLYSPYAWEAFTAGYRHTPRKVLFQYHPYAELQERILACDSRRYPNVGESFSDTSSRPLPKKLARREMDSWKRADLILCASDFTRRSLLEAGADERICRVIPYGVEITSTTRTNSRAGTFHALFVGSGNQRKGLHHLLSAWKQATLPSTSKLTLVCRMIDHEIERMARETPGVELVRGMTQDQLNVSYANGSLLVMPSLVEGFGQVYLEALAHGCPVLGTPNTCLPDLGGEQDGIFLVTPGDVDELTEKLERLSGIVVSAYDLRRAARACAERFTWPLFREGIRQALQN